MNLKTYAVHIYDIWTYFYICVSAYATTMKKLHMSMWKNSFCSVIPLQAQCLLLPFFRQYWTYPYSLHWDHVVLWNCFNALAVASYKNWLTRNPGAGVRALFNHWAKPMGSFPAQISKVPWWPFFQCWTTTIHNSWELNLNTVLKATISGAPWPITQFNA